MDLAKTQVMAALKTSSHKPGALPLALCPPKNCCAVTLRGLNRQTIRQYPASTAQGAKEATFIESL